MKKEIDISKLVTFAKYAELNSNTNQPLSRQRVIQLVNEGRLKAVIVSGKKFLQKNAPIKPSKKKLGRPKLKK